MRYLILIPAILFCFFSCKEQAEQKPEFLEIRITRWTALTGAETFLMRKVGKDWSAVLMGDSEAFNCFFQKWVKPKSDWEDLWQALKKEGILEIPNGNYSAGKIHDGSGFLVEAFDGDKIRKYSFFLPELIDSKEAKQILRIGDSISREFQTPLFKPDFSSDEAKDYFTENCNKNQEGKNRE